MKEMNQIWKGLCILLWMLSIPVFSYGCGMSAIGGMYGGSGLLGDLILLGGIFLAGYLPYLFLSIRLSRQASKGTITSFTRIGAAIFALINTVVFFALVGFVVEFSTELFLCDLLLWGVPMLFFIKGLQGGKSMEKQNMKEELLDS